MDAVVLPREERFPTPVMGPRRARQASTPVENILLIATVTPRLADGTRELSHRARRLASALLRPPHDGGLPGIDTPEVHIRLPAISHVGQEALHTPVGLAALVIDEVAVAALAVSAGDAGLGTSADPLDRTSIGAVRPGATR